LKIDRKCFTKAELAFYDNFNSNDFSQVSGEFVFNMYKNIVFGESDFIRKMINKKQIGGIMSKFMFSIFTDSKLNKELLSYCDHEDEVFEKFGLIYLSHWEKVYSLEGGIDDSQFETDLFI
jgi:CRISPR-associated endonuclease/helicase Cas3